MVWFEIPATDFERAARFYEQIFAVTVKKERMGPQTMGVFPYETPAISGCVMAGQGLVPGGANADPALAVVVERVAAAGGQVLLPRMELLRDFLRKMEGDAGEE